MPFLGAIPIDPKLTACFDTGQNFIEKFPESGAFAAYQTVAGAVVAQCAKASARDDVE